MEKKHFGNITCKKRDMFFLLAIYLYLNAVLRNFVPLPVKLPEPINITNLPPPKQVWDL
jgi:hypothetical protein